MIKNMDTLIKKYVLAAIAHGEGISVGNHITANQPYRVSTKLYREFQQDPELAQQSLEVLMEHPSDYVRLWAAAHAVGLGIELDKARIILMEIAHRRDIIGFDAQMTLQEWNRRGTLTF